MGANASTKKPWVKPGAYKRKSGLTDAEYYEILNSIPEDLRDNWDERIHTKNKSIYEDRRIQVCASAFICNKASDFNRDRVLHQWYIDEARKLIECLEERTPQ